MKKMLFITLMFFGTGLAEDLNEKYRNLGISTWESSDLVGKVQSVKECTKEYDEFECEILTFSRNGVEQNEAKNRTISIKNDIVEINYDNGNNQYSALFKNGKLIEKNKYKAGKLIVRHVRKYENNTLTEMINYDANHYETGRSVYSYKNGVLYKDSVVIKSMFEDLEFVNIYNEKGLVVSLSGPGYTHQYTYEYDPMGNWIKEYQDGELYRTRSITYH